MNQFGINQHLPKQNKNNKNVALAVNIVCFGLYSKHFTVKFVKLKINWLFCRF